MGEECSQVGAVIMKHLPNFPSNVTMTTRWRTGYIDSEVPKNAPVHLRELAVGFFDLALTFARRAILDCFNPDSTTLCNLRIQHRAPQERRPEQSKGRYHHKQSDTFKLCSLLASNGSKSLFTNLKRPPRRAPSAGEGIYIYTQTSTLLHRARSRTR